MAKTFKPITQKASAENIIAKANSMRIGEKNLSVSALSSWHKCPLIFKARALELVDYEASEDMEYGTRMHDEVEAYIKGKVQPTKYSELWKVLRGVPKNDIVVEEKIITAIRGLSRPVSLIADIVLPKVVIDLKTRRNKKTPLSWWMTKLLSHQAALYTQVLKRTRFGIYCIDTNEYRECSIPFGVWANTFRMFSCFNRWLDSEQTAEPTSSWLCKTCPLVYSCPKGKEKVNESTDDSAQ